MFSGERLLTSFLIFAISATAVIGDAPVVSPQYYSAPTKDYQNPAPSTHYNAPSPGSGSTYGVPSSQYGADTSGYVPGPPPSYGIPAPDNAYESLRDFSLSQDSSFVTRRLFNTSVALTVPLFSFTLPQRASQGSTVDLANQAIFGLFSLLVVVLIFAVPILFTGSRPAGITGRSNDRNGILNNLMSSNKVFNFMGADLTNNIGLDVEKCFQKTICEAHRSPKKYGVLATPFLMFFPPPSNRTADAKASLFQLAAKEGKTKKGDCGKKFKCFFDLLDLADYCIDWWKYSANPNLVVEA